MSDLPPPLRPDIAVQDAVHGRIWLTRVEQAVIDTPEFQRLRAIGQLGLAHYVFPSALHTRFVHSLGATHVIGWMLRQQPLQEYFQDRAELIQCLRLAALLHDIGHYPFSHLGENVWGSASRGAISLYSGETADRTVFDVAAQIERDNATSHEQVTAAVIQETSLQQIIDQELGQVDGRAASEVVASIIDGSYPDVVCQNLVSSDLDCDRLDYLVRDSLAAGLTYGLIDLAYLIENLVVVDHETFGPMLAVKKAHGSQAVEHYVLARYYHYAQFITHKTIASAEMLLAVAILELIRIDKLPNAEGVLDNVAAQSFLGLNDASVWTLIAEAPEAAWASDDLKEASRRLRSRDLLKVAFAQDQLEEEAEKRGHIDYLFGTPARKDIAAERAGIPSERFCYKRGVLALVGIPAKLTASVVIEDRKAIEAQWVKTVKVAEPDGSPELLVEQPGLLGNLSARRWVTRRLFVREPEQHPGKDDRPNCEALAVFVKRELET